MNNSPNTESDAPPATAAQKLSWWQLLKTKRISYFTIPLLVMATVVEYVILATGWKYQQAVCLPPGMGVTFFGIGPIGATILAVELLKLPLAIWTASRDGLQKKFMLFAGLPLICVLTFQLVKDMAVYEMGIAMQPAAEALEKAAAEEVKIVHLNGELKAIEQKKIDRETKLTELAEKKVKAKADLEEALKRNDESRQDAISLTDYQKKELAEEEARQAAITKQYNADAAQLSAALADLRARREAELPNATKWNEEEARIENAYKTKLADYTNKKTAYEKDKLAYESASFLMRQVMRQPVDPGVAPEREVNKLMKPTQLTDLDEQIKAKEAELLAVNNKRRDRVAQVGDNAQQLRKDFDQRSRAKREEADRKRDELMAAYTTLTTEWKAEEKQIDAELTPAVQRIDTVRAELDAARKTAESYYEARENAIRHTQVHRIATTVEIVRGLLFGERPMSITASAKERGDILTDQISMVRIWVYPVFAFIVAFLPTLMVEIGFSTVFKPELKTSRRKERRDGFFARNLHRLYIRAGRHKILRAERLIKEASTKIAGREQALLDARREGQKALSDKTAEAQAAREALQAATTAHEEQLKWQAAEHEEQLKLKEAEWVAKFGSLADSLNRAAAEKDALLDFQKSEIERQVQARQGAWTERVNQLRQELDTQRHTYEKERAALFQEQQQKIQAVMEDCQKQIVQAKRQAAETERLAQETVAKASFDLKQALEDREAADRQLQQQTESLTLQLAQAQEEAAREHAKSLRQEKFRLERQQLDFDKALREQNEEADRCLKQREQELLLEAEDRLLREQARAEQQLRHREEEFERQLEARGREVELRWKQEWQQREEAAQIQAKQREQQLQAQAAQSLRQREAELERQLDAQAREAETRLKQELQAQQLTYTGKLQQLEKEFTAKNVAREIELQNKWAEDLRGHEQEWQRQAEARARAVEARLQQEIRQKDEIFEVKLRQREQQLYTEFAAREIELQSQTQHFQRRQEEASADANQRALRELELQLRLEMQQKEEAAQARHKKQEQEFFAQINAQLAAHKTAQQQWETQFTLLQRDLEPLNQRLAQTEKERDEARHRAAANLQKVQTMEKKLTAASSLLTDWKNGNGNGDHSTRNGLDVREASLAVLSNGHSD